MKAADPGVGAPRPFTLVVSRAVKRAAGVQRLEAECLEEVSSGLGRRPTNATLVVDAVSVPGPMFRMRGRWLIRQCRSASSTDQGHHTTTRAGSHCCRPGLPAVGRALGEPSRL